MIASGIPGRRREGFTLVEVVVSLAILSLILLATVTGLRTLGNTQGAIDRLTARVDEVRSVSSFLRDTLESAAAGAATAGGLSLGGSGRESAYLELGDSFLAWKSTVLFGEAYGGSFLLRVAKEDDALVLRWQEPNDSGKPGDWGAAPARGLVAEVDEFEVSWRENYADDWHREWTRDDEVAWVRLQIRAAGRYWPELIMQVPQ